MVNVALTTAWRRRAGFEVGWKNVKYIQNCGRQNLKRRENLGDYRISERIDALSRSRRASARTFSDSYRVQSHNGRYTS